MQMNSSSFEIKILRQHWIEDNGNYDKNDLCSHGEVYLRIGVQELSTEESGSWTLSATGLFLLRSLEQDCAFYEFSNQLLPCCGFSIFPNDEKKNFVDIHGCPHGVDWKITHRENDVIFESEKNSKAKLTFQEYRKIVLDFTDEVERFYGNPKDKVVGGDSYDCDGFIQFWAEWRELKRKWQ